MRLADYSSHVLQCEGGKASFAKLFGQFCANEMNSGDLVVAFARQDFNFELVWGSADSVAPGEVHLSASARSTLTSAIAPRSFVKLRDLGDSITNHRGFVDMADGARNAFVIPLGSQGKLLGFVMIWSSEPLSQTLTVAADITSIAYELWSFRIDLKADMEGAWAIQNRMLPSEFPKSADIEYYTVFRPAKVVSGDFYDVFVRGGDLFAVVADVAGKGIPAALMMANLHAALAARVIDKRDRIAELMLDLHALVVNTSPPSKYATMLFAAFNQTTCTLQYVSCGHYPPGLLIRPRAVDPIELSIGGPVLGLTPTPAEPFRVGRLNMQPGDFVILCTDGVVDSTRDDGTQFDLDGLKRVCAASCRIENSAATVARAIMTAVDEFIGEAEQFDDITISVLKVLR